jgi:hypothetical protein
VSGTGQEDKKRGPVFCRSTEASKGVVKGGEEGAKGKELVSATAIAVGGVVRLIDQIR